MNQLLTGGDRYLPVAKELPLQDASVSPPTTPPQPCVSMNKPRSSCSILNAPAQRASAQTWCFQNDKLRWLSLPKKSRHGLSSTRGKSWARTLKAMLTILLVSASLILVLLDLLFHSVAPMVIIGMWTLSIACGYWSKTS